MITRSKLRRGEGVLEETNPQIASRRPQTPQVMAREEGQELMYEDERAFIKALYDIFEMVKALYNDRTRFHRESSNNQKVMMVMGESLHILLLFHLHIHFPSSLRPIPPTYPRGHAKSPFA